VKIEGEKERGDFCRISSPELSTLDSDIPAMKYKMMHKPLLCLIVHHSTRTHGKLKIKIHELTLALDGGE
jgi:hypothetical protein